MTELTPVDVTDLPLVADVVHEALRNAIIQGKLLPGERLVETQLAEQLGVSRTPVRDVYKRQEYKGIGKFRSR